jgi:hypothetical protein
MARFVAGDHPNPSTDRVPVGAVPATPAPRRTRPSARECLEPSMESTPPPQMARFVAGDHRTLPPTGPRRRCPQRRGHHRDERGHPRGIASTWSVETTAPPQMARFVAGDHRTLPPTGPRRRCPPATRAPPRRTRPSARDRVDMERGIHRTPAGGPLRRGGPPNPSADRSPSALCQRPRHRDERVHQRGIASTRSVESTAPPQMARFVAGTRPNQSAEGRRGHHRDERGHPPGIALTRAGDRHQPPQMARFVAARVSTSARGRAHG